MTNSLKEEAAACRALAAKFAGRPERPFLLSLSKALDDLATHGRGLRGHSD